MQPPHQQYMDYFGQPMMPGYDQQYGRMGLPGMQPQLGGVMQGQYPAYPGQQYLPQTSTNQQQMYNPTMGGLMQPPYPGAPAD